MNRSDEFDLAINRLDRAIKILYFTAPLAIVVQTLYHTGILHSIIFRIP